MINNALNMRLATGVVVTLASVALVFTRAQAAKAPAAIQGASANHWVAEATPPPAGYPAMKFTTLGAYGTRTTQVTLYWGNYPKASGYNIYRGTSPGKEGPKPIAKNVLHADPNPGVHCQMFSNSGLETGRRYSYVVKAIVHGHEVATTEEASATPDKSAVPYDTNDPAEITAALMRGINAFKAAMHGKHPIGDPVINVTGPDGTAYTSSNVPVSKPRPNT